MIDNESGEFEYTPDVCLSPVAEEDEGEEEEEDTQLWEADYSCDVFTTESVTTNTTATDKMSPINGHQSLEQSITISSNMTSPTQTADELQNLLADSEKEFCVYKNTFNLSSSIPMSTVDNTPTPIPTTIFHTPSRPPSAANQNMLSGSARRLSLLAEQYPTVGNHKNNCSPSFDTIGGNNCKNIIDSVSDNVASIRRASQISPSLPQLNRRFNRRSVLGDVPFSPHSQTLSPMHEKTIITENNNDYNFQKDSNDTSVAANYTNENSEKNNLNKKRRNAIPPITPPRSYVESAFTKENKMNNPNTESLLQSVRSVCEIFILFFIFQFSNFVT